MSIHLLLTVYNLFSQKYHYFQEQIEFYDENEDDENERWVAEERKRRKGQQVGEKTGKDNADSKQKQGKAK